ncbi:hypothetical protein C0993_012539 [Termitomyces sp. T159_Od127]|nr:hypothetical protein C0993_012539 [Termitomyces sp. T159_Od127]
MLKTAPDASVTAAANADADAAPHLIKGNVSEEEKRAALKILSHFVSTRERSYGADVGQQLRLVEINVWERDGHAATGQTIFEVDVTKEMCNVFGTLHGACAAYMVDPCSVSSLVVLGNATGIDGTGVSQSMNLIWHQPARVYVAPPPSPPNLTLFF